MVAFLVEADLVLSDKATKMLRELGAQFEKLDKLAKGIGKNFASEGIGRASKQMETLAKAARTASESTKALGESLNRLRISPAASSGVTKLATELKSAQSAAQKGWICPVCGHGVAPDEKTCNHGALIPGMPLTPPIQPLVPYKRGQCPACAESGICCCYRPERDSPTATTVR